MSGHGDRRPRGAHDRSSSSAAWQAEDGAVGVLCADGHVGYSQPVGGAVAYRDHISVSGVGYDIGCGNKAVRTDLRHEDIAADLPRIMDAIVERISFGVGRRNDEPVDHPVLDAIRTADARAPALAGRPGGQAARHRRRRQPLRRPVRRRGRRRVGRRALRLARLRPQDGDHATSRWPASRRAGWTRRRRCCAIDSELGQEYIAAMTLAVRLRLRRAATWWSTACSRSSAPPPPTRSTTTTTSPARETPRRRGLVGRAQGLHAGLPGPAGLRRLDDGRARA